MNHLPQNQPPQAGFEPGETNPAEMEVSSSSEEGSELESDEEDKQRYTRVHQMFGDNVTVCMG